MGVGGAIELRGSTRIFVGEAELDIESDARSREPNSSSTAAILGNFADGSGSHATSYAFLCANPSQVFLTYAAPSPCSIGGDETATPNFGRPFGPGFDSLGRLAVTPVVPGAGATTGLHAVA